MRPWIKLRSNSCRSSASTLRSIRTPKTCPGSPSIPDTILQKIATSDAVVADLTLTHTSDKQADLKKRGSNPNVMFEYGYALRKSDQNIFGVINKAFGEPEELPFDLRERRSNSDSRYKVEKCPS